jgi:hypothetical protein
MKCSFMIFIPRLRREFLLEGSKVINLILSSLEAYPTDLTLYDIVIDIIPILALAAAITYYVYISKSQNKTRKAQLFMQIYSRFQDKEFLRQNIEIMNMEWTDFNDFWEKYGLIVNPEATSVIFSVGTYFEGIGVLVNEKLIDVKLVDDLMTGLIVRYWEKMEPIIKKQRALFNWPEAYEWTEYLYNKIKSLNK